MADSTRPNVDEHQPWVRDDALGKARSAIRRTAEGTLAPPDDKAFDNPIQFRGGRIANPLNFDDLVGFPLAKPDGSLEGVI